MGLIWLFAILMVRVTMTSEKPLLFPTLLSGKVGFEKLVNF